MRLFLFTFAINIMWEELKKTALLGTDRHQLPEKEMAYLRKMGLDMEQESALVILDAVSMWSKMKKVGLELQKWDSLQEEVVESSTHPPTLKLTDAIAALFKYNGFEVLLPQTIELLNQKDISFPSEMYPELIQYFERHLSDFVNLQDLLDQRFYWLVKQNPAWIAFQQELHTEQIEKIKDINLKAFALNQFVTSSGDEAVGYTYNEWENFSPQLQARFLRDFAPESSEMADSFFDKVAAPKHKDTYRYALRYYSYSKNEAFLGMLSERIEELLSFSRKKVKVNEEAIQHLKSVFLKKHLPIYGLDKGYGFDAKNLLFNFFCLVPLTHLCDTLDCSWPDFMQGLASNNELHELLLLGLIYSAAHDPIDQELVLQMVLKGKLPILEDMDLLPVYEQLSSEQLHQLYLQLNKAKFSFNDNAMETLLFCEQFKWPDELCKKVLQVIPVRLLNADDTKSDPNFKIFRHMVLNCRAELYPVVNATFQANPVYSWNSTKIIEKQLNILKMRFQINDEL